jgi:hypothetical protein
MYPQTDRKGNMIWAIGDIHGKAELLNKVLEGIRKSEKSAFFGPSQVEKIIFIGDYIDHGPDSKEVLDTIIDLEYEKVCLAGDHEDLYLQFTQADPNDRKNQLSLLRTWRNEHAQVTLNSILKDSEHENILGNFMSYFNIFAKSDKIDPRDIPDENQLLKQCSQVKVPISSLVFPEKYDRFIRELNYSHREVFKIQDRQVGFSFFHSTPAWDQSLEDQLKIRSFQDFLTYLESDTPHFGWLSYVTGFDYLDLKNSFKISKLDRRDTFLQLRTYAIRWGYGQDVVVHGHFPTHEYIYGFSSINDNPDFAFLLQSFNRDLAWPFLWTRGPKWTFKKPTRPKNPLSTDTAFREIEFNTAKGGAVEAINIDTGAVDDQALTAIGLSDETLSQGLIPVISAFDEKNEKYPGLCCERLIRVQNLGTKKDNRRQLLKIMNDFTNQINALRSINPSSQIDGFDIDKYTHSRY